MKTFKEFNNINESKINEDSNGLQGVKEYRDGLTPEMIQIYFPWLLKAKFKNAVIGLDEDVGLAWYDGTWEKGTWKDGMWYDGTWKNGKWLNGFWENGVWEKGTWEDGYWGNGIWKDGTWKDGKIADDSYNFTRSKNHPV